MMEICPATWTPKAINICIMLVKQKRDPLGLSTLKVVAVLVYPINTIKKKFMAKSQYRY